MEEPAVDQSDSESIRNEYLDTSNNMRHQGNLRFAQMTLFVAITAGLVSVLFTNQVNVPTWAKTSFKAFGFITAVAFIVMEEVYSRLLASLSTACCRVGAALGLPTGSSTLPTRSFFSCVLDHRDSTRITSEATPNLEGCSGEARNATLVGEARDSHDRPA